MELYKNLPSKKFATLVLDPPWQITLSGKRNVPRHSGADALPYRTLTVEQIKAFPVPTLATVGAHVYCWTTNRMLPATFDVLEAWGVNYHLTLVMTKRSGIAPCNGYVFAAEYCLLGFFGKPMLPFCSIGKLNWLTVNPCRGKHSAKPDEFYQLVEEMSPGPRLDCFARRQRPEWGDVWGDEV